MVALEPSEPLLLYITATAEFDSLVLVAERLDPQPQVPKAALARGSGSKDSEPMGEVVGSQLPEPSLAHETQIGSQSLEPIPGPLGHTATRSHLSEAV
jgi:hypothetical protein